VSEQLLTIAQAAERLGCAPRTVRRRIDAGTLPVFRDGRLVRIRESDLHAHIARCTITPTRPPARVRSAPVTPRSQPAVRSLFDLPDPLIDQSTRIDLSSDETRKCPGSADTPRGRQQGGTP
jgi:excisionase family DNA binding protein